MLTLKDVVQTQSGLVELPAYNGEERKALKDELFKLTGIELPKSTMKSVDKEPTKLEVENV